MEKRAAPKLLADHRGRLEQRPLFRLEPIEPGGQQGLNRVGEGKLVSVLSSQGEQLLEEERVALGRLGRPRPGRGIELGGKRRDDRPRYYCRRN